MRLGYGSRIWEPETNLVLMADVDEPDIPDPLPTPPEVPDIPPSTDRKRREPRLELHPQCL